jgi:N-methylhydantoinase A
MQRTRLAVDIGGTFTDVALEHEGRLSTTKVLTTPSAPERGVKEGVAAILSAAGLAAEDVAIVIHGTTLATNAIIERKGARTALITTEGHRDVLALRNESRYDQYDLNIILPEPLVPRHLRLPVPERLDNEGRVRAPLDERAVRALIPLLRRQKVESIAIGYLHAFVNPVHELRTREILAAELPDIPISLACEVSPEMREWERFSTTAANAYVQPFMERYLRRLESELRGMGFRAPIFLMLSGGGLATMETACRFPIRMIESGPAGGAIFAAEVARKCALPRVVSFDMGGTTAKICLIDDFRPQTARSCEVARVGRFKKGSGLPLRIPVIEMVEIGAGGGSLAYIDAMGRIAVGPESSGADPGPACYGRGGVHPSVTDANLLLGRYDPEAFAGGTLVLKTDAARTAVAADVGLELELDPQMAALGIVEIVDENMANAARVHAIESGKTFEGRALIAFGDNVVRSFYQRLGRLDLAAVNAMFAEMEREAEGVVAQGNPGAPVAQVRLAYMRYVGQGHEIPVPLPLRRLQADDVATIRAAYEAEYAKFYDRLVPGAEIEVLSYEVTVSTLVPEGPKAVANGGGSDAATVRRRRVRDPATGTVAEWTVHARNALTVGKPIAGPAIIAEDETSTLVAPNWTAELDASGYIHLTREARQ